MGYRTYYGICIEDGDPTPEDLQKITKLLESFEDFESWGDEWYGSELKWYDYLDDMYTLSKAFPQFRFYVHGDGDDSDDLWEDHWQDGRFQHCYAEIPPYDPAKMTPYVPTKQHNDE